MARIPTSKTPCRSVAPTGSSSGSVAGLYQAEVQLPLKPTKRSELLAFAEAARSLAELAENWADQEITAEGDGTSTRKVLLDVTIRMIPGKSEAKSG